MSEVKYTAEQQAAIDYAHLGSHNLLISASAGTGKTSTLTERIIRRLLSEAEGLEPHQLLITTFTDKAAKSMRDKFEQTVQKALRMCRADDFERKERLLQLQLALPSIQITTIHSFCKNLLNDYLNTLQDEEGKPLLDVGFGVMEQTAASLLLSDSIEEVLDSIYVTMAEWSKSAELRAIDFSEVADSDRFSVFLANWYSLVDQNPSYELTAADRSEIYEIFTLMTSVLADTRDDRKLREKIRMLLGRLRSLGHYRDFARSSLADFAACADFEAQPSIKSICQQVVDIAKRSRDFVSEIENCAFYHDKIFGSAAKSSKEVEQFIENWPSIKQSIIEISNLTEPTWDELWEMRPKIRKNLTFRPSKDLDKTEFIDLYGSGISPFIACFQKITETHYERYQIEHRSPLITKISAADQKRAIENSSAVLRSFFALALTVDQVYQEHKLENNSIDFDDMQHYALAILENDKVAAALRERYREIYIDEYQDTNNVQESIISRFADNNVFMVGDVKQSIYRFRYANPELFNQKNHTYTLLSTTEQSESGDVHGSYANEAEVSEGYRQPFRTNFRCDKPIVDFVNDFFAKMMHEENADIEYNDEHKLICGRKYSEDVVLPKPQLTLVMHTQEQAGYVYEAKACALQIQAILDEAKERGETLHYSDFMVLAPTNDMCRHYAEELEDCGIPCIFGREQSIFDAREVRLCIDFFRLLDNFCQDIPLATVMRSELWYQRAVDLPRSELEPAQSDLPDISPFSEQELQAIADSSKADFFYQKVLNIVEETDADKIASWQEQKVPVGKLLAFYSFIKHCREQLQQQSLAQFFEQFLLRSGYRDYLALLPNADRKLSNLQLFRQHLLAYDQQYHASINEYVVYLENFFAHGLQEKDYITVSSPEEDVVRIMTIHAAKGLEADYVFLVDLNKQNRPMKRDFLCIGEGGERSRQSGLTETITAKSILYRRDPQFTHEPHFQEIQIFESPFYREHQLLQQNKEQAERLRVLYVALTRAKRELRIFASQKISKTTNLFEKSDRSLDQYRGYFAYFLNYLSGTEHSAEIKNGFSRIVEDENWLSFDNEFLKFNLCHSDYFSEREVADQMDLALGNHLVPTDKSYERYWQDLEYGRVDHANKITVTELKRQSDRVASADEEQSEAGASVHEINLSLHKIEDIAADRSRGAAYGSFLHSLIQYIPLDLFDGVGEDDRHRCYLEHLQAMIEAQQLAPNDRELAEQAYPALSAYLLSDLAKRVRRADVVFRESPFAVMYDREAGTLIQGIIDLWFIEGGELVLVDFKSDYLRKFSDPAAELQQRYQLQLNEYAKALQAMNHLSVKEKLIWSLDLNRQFELP